MTVDHPVKRRKKLIEVAIPLEAINAASAREKSIRHGHPSTLHLWWARRPLAAARAVIFCQMVDDPSAVPEEFPTEEDQENERLRLFTLISELVTWENTTNEEVLNRAREEIRRSWRRCCADNADHPEAAELFNPERLPGFHDPFAGGGALPLEAQRLGLESYASDLNPVAVLINKAMIEIPPKFAGMPPVNPESRSKKELIARKWKGAEGLAEDVRYYGKWIREEAEKRIGHLYPKVLITPEMVNDPANPRPDLKPYEGQELKVIAWIWARTVKSPNPAFSNIDVPLVSTFMLSANAGKEAFVEPVVHQDDFSFTVKVCKPSDESKAKSGTKVDGRGANFRCLMSQALISGEYLKGEGMAGRIGTRLMAIVAEGNRGRVYLPPVSEHIAAAQCINDSFRPTLQLPEESKGRTAYWCKLYGLTDYGRLFTERQLVSLTTFSDLITEVREIIKVDAAVQGLENSDVSLHEGGNGASAYADALSVYLAFALSKQADLGNSLCRWEPIAQCPRQLFGRQAIPMIWDYAEGNPLGSSSGAWEVFINGIAKAFAKSFGNNVVSLAGSASQDDAATQRISSKKVVSTDPPYYDNIGYADLSDFFYAWLRRSLRDVFPALFSTLSTPKAAELVAIPYRHGSKANAELFFLEGMTLAMQKISAQSNQAYPVTIYYAFKQSETKSSSGTSSTGWETFLAAVIKSGFSLKGTWPLNTENSSRMIGQGTNALASSVVLVCERKKSNEESIARSEFRRRLRSELPKALKELERANIAPVDVAQAAIGPGMAIYSSAKVVLNPDDTAMSVRDALVEINTALDEYLSQDEGDLDEDSRFALTFFESYGYSERPYGDAEGLAVARNVSVDGVARAGILSAIAGKVQLLRRDQLDDDWDPSRDERLCVWEATQHLIKRLDAGGEPAGAALLAQLKDLSGHGDLAANCRALAYRLYNHCEKTKQAEEARAYNGLVIAWPELEKLAAAASSPVQQTLL
jgi:putative DNA methylase